MLTCNTIHYDNVNIKMFITNCRQKYVGFFQVHRKLMRKLKLNSTIYSHIDSILHNNARTKNDNSTNNNIIMRKNLIKD